MMKFKSNTYGSCENIEVVMNHIFNKMNSNRDSEWLLAIGTDSQNREQHTKITSAIVLLEVGKGGIFFHSTQRVNRIQVLHHRMIEESRISIELGREMLDLLNEAYENEVISIVDTKLKLEIHCDLNEEGGSRVAVKEAVGWILAEFGGVFTPQIKPNGSAASTIADIYTK